MRNNWISNKEVNPNVHTEVIWSILQYKNNAWEKFLKGRVDDEILSFWMPSINIDDNGVISLIFSGSASESVEYTPPYILQEKDFMKIIFQLQLK